MLAGNKCTGARRGLHRVPPQQHGTNGRRLRATEEPLAAGRKWRRHRRHGPVEHQPGVRSSSRRLAPPRTARGHTHPGRCGRGTPGSVTRRCDLCPPPALSSPTPVLGNATRSDAAGDAEQNRAVMRFAQRSIRLASRSPTRAQRRSSALMDEGDGISVTWAQSSTSSPAAAAGEHGMKPLRHDSGGAGIFDSARRRQSRSTRRLGKTGNPSTHRAPRAKLPAASRQSRAM